MKTHSGLAVLAILLVGVASAQVPDPKTGGPGGAPISLLVLSDDARVDARYENDLAAAGYRLARCSYHNRLSRGYLKQFNAVLLTRLPFAGQRYQVGGDRLAPLAENLRLLREYLQAGGGVIHQPAMSEFGEAYADVYNRFVKPYGARYIPQQLRDDAATKGAYAAGRVVGKHPITEGLKDVLYPIHVLRWDHAYSTTPVVVGKEWTLLAAGKAGSGTHQALDNSRVGERLTPNRTLAAVRKVGKGLLVLTAVHSYYTLTHAYSKSKYLGENDTGVIDGIVLGGETGGRPSEFGKLLDRAYRHLAANSTAHGFGGKAVALPAQPKPPSISPSIDWHTATPPPTWQHRVAQAWKGGTATYDELPDPTAKGEVTYYKALIGPRSACSSGAGSVAEWRAAAVKVGYSAIVFCETFPDTTAEKWRKLLRDCDAATDESFVCLPGLDIEDFQGGRYLVLGARRYPDRTWLTKDATKLEAVRMLSLGWYGHVASVHRSGRTRLHPMMYKHYQGITVYTYDGKGRCIDDALHAYQWAVASDSNPIPIAAHELTSPAEVALAARSGCQQVLPGVGLRQAVHYFRFALPHYFDCPLRYFISEGPILDGWSIRNKDLGRREERRDHWRLGIGVRGEQPITEATLYDGLRVVRRWRPGKASFRTTVDGFHDGQHEFLLLARDAKGRRVLSPGIRTTTRNWRLRCGDRQNWLGSMWIYTGWTMFGFGNYHVPLHNTREGGSGWIGDGGGNPCVIFDYPYFSNHVQIMDVDVSTKYVDAGWGLIGGDAKSPYAVRPTDFTDGRVRTTYFVPRSGKFAAARVDAWVRLKRDVEPDLRGGLFPVFARPMGKNELLILPGRPARKLAEVRQPVDLPAGSYVGGIITLTDGLRLSGRQIGLPAPPPETLTLAKGTTYEASYLVCKTGSFHWRQLGKGYETDAIAGQVLKEMGFAGKRPYSLTLSRGKLDTVTYAARLTAAGGGVAGRCTGAGRGTMLFDVPLRIRPLNPRCQSALWRSDRKYLEYFSCFGDEGLVTLAADAAAEFYAGNVARCAPALFVSVVIWNDKEAHFRLHNPTRRDITTSFETPRAIRGFRPVKKQVTIKAGCSVDVRG